MSTIFCFCSPFSPILSLYPLLRSYHRNLDLPRFRFPSTFWASALLASFSSPILSIGPAHFNLLLIKFILKHSFTPTPNFSSSTFLLSVLLTPVILLTQLVFVNLHFLLLFLWYCHHLQTIHVCRGNTRREHLYLMLMSHHPFESPARVSCCY